MWQFLNRPAVRAALLLTAFAAPSLAFAAGSAFAPIIPQPGDACYCAGSAMDWGCILQVVQNVINIAISIGTFMIIFWILYAGAMMLMNPLSSQARTEARNRLLNAFIGLVVILSSWLIVDYVMKFLYDPGTSHFGPWNSILAPNPSGVDRCIKPTNPTALSSLDVGTILNPGSGGASGGTGGGSCTVLSDGPCSPAALATTCFSNRAQDASKICNVESAGGDPGAESTGDRVDNGKGPSYSVGLWQINLTNSNLMVNGQNCNDAFTGSCGSGTVINKTGACSVSIKDQVLYGKCKAAAETPEINTQAACRLSHNGSTFQPWLNTIGTCSISKT